ncbi:MAG: hypothetical protein EAX81_00570 [Candidatus Thorarchaeota archaeon]|nr:hypothetical protein [Candidatus Thorarchaeota archaeon]
MALDFLKTIDYIVLEDMLYLGIEFLIPNKTLSLPEHQVRFSYTNNNVLLGKHLYGLVLRIDAHLGWVRSFSRTGFLLPTADTSYVIAPSLVEELVKKKMGDSRAKIIKMNNLLFARRGWELPWEIHQIEILTCLES